ncbi:MAG TPA: hypothetical protein VK034_11920 [Enhygromyxa sp.]|nr:hypothetical protein [Enhygromyxa sp.]
MSDKEQLLTTKDKKAEELILLLKSTSLSLEVLQLVECKLDEPAEARDMLRKKRKAVHEQTVGFAADCLRTLFGAQQLAAQAEARILASEVWANAPEMPPSGDALAQRLRLLAGACRLTELVGKDSRVRGASGEEKPSTSCSDP